MELLPCPFCGSNKISLDTINLIVHCFECKIGIFKQLWNTRNFPWISVKDKLPENDDLVLTFYYNMRSINKKIGYHIGFYNGEYWQESTEYTQIDVTHWMPLPQLPKEIG